MKPYVLGATFVRGGSKGIPRKNIKELFGKPLIAYAIQAAQAVSLIDHYIVSTDDKEIADVATKYGADVPFLRPKELATDDSSVLLAWKHAVEVMEGQSGKKIDVLVDIPATSPLRDSEDVEKCIWKLMESKADVVITVTEAQRNPYFNMVKLDDAENAEIVIDGGDVIVNRQDAPEIYDVTTVAYAINTDYLKKTDSLLRGKVKVVVIPRERSLDIDTPFDFELAEYLMKKKNDE